MQESARANGIRGGNDLRGNCWKQSFMRLTVAFSLCLMLGMQVAGAVLRVPGQFSSIQEAVNAAKPGDIIQVQAGTYCENVVITKSDLRLRATPNGRAILTGSCSPGGPHGIHVLGSADTPVSGVEIMGFVVENFRIGILLHEVTRSRIHLNEVRNNTSVTAPGTAHGILLMASTFNEVTQNVARENSHLGIGLFGGSSSNTVRGNRLYDNQAQLPNTGWCSLMIWGSPPSNNNQVVENEVVGERGMGIMVGPQAPTGNVIGQNRVHGHAEEGIVTAGMANGNVIQQNDARGNAKVDWFDLGEWSVHPDGNIWLRNLGTCPPGSGICRE
jgi:parallel beta-helix repeat protein